MICSKLCYYSDAYIHVKATITVPNTAAAAAPEIVLKKLYLKIVFHLLIA